MNSRNWMKTQKSATFAKTSLNINTLVIKIMVQLTAIVIMLVNTEVLHICNLKYSVTKEIPVFLHNGSNYNYHFIIKEIAKEFEGKFNCLGENTQKYRSFSVPITKQLKRIGKNGEEITKPIS